MRKPNKQKKPLNDLTRSLTPFDPNQTLITVVELSKKELARCRDHPWRGAPAVEEARGR
jgi:hypothetical protein